MGIEWCFLKFYDSFRRLPWLFERAGNNYWNNTHNQRKYIDWLRIQLFSENCDLSAWYRSEQHSFNRGLLSKFNVPLYIAMILMLRDLQVIILWQNSHSALLQAVYSEEYEFLPWMFSHSPKSFWKDVDNQRKYFDWLEKELKLVSKEEWYKVTKEMIEQRHGTGLLQFYKNSLFSALKTIYLEVVYRFAEKCLIICIQDLYALVRLEAVVISPSSTIVLDLNFQSEIVFIVA